MLDMILITVLVKALGSVMIIGGGTAYGFSKSYTLDDRVKDIQELEKIIAKITTQIEYNKTPIPKILIKLCSKISTKYKILFEEIVKTMNKEKINPYDALQYVIKNKKLDLDKNVITILLDIFKDIGTSDVEGEINNLKASNADLVQFRNETIEYRDKYKKIYQYGGGLAGALITLFLV